MFWYFYILHSLVVAFLALFSTLDLWLVVIFAVVAFVISKMKDEKFTDYQPSISIIVPAYNEEKNIRRCLDSIFSSDYPVVKLEVLCIDDGSTDTTRNIMEEYAKKYSQISIVKGQHQGKALALNKAIGRTTHELVLLLDADMNLDAQYLSHIVLPLQNTRVSYTIGVTRIASEKKLIEHFQGIELCYGNFIKRNIVILSGFPHWFSGQAVCFRKSALLAVGGFVNDTLVEDFDLILRLHHAGYRAKFVREAIAYTQPMKTISQFMDQRMRWYYGNIQALFKHKRVISFRTPIFVYITFAHSLWLATAFLVLPSFFLVSLLRIGTKPFDGIMHTLISGTLIENFSVVRDVIMQVEPPGKIIGTFLFMSLLLLSVLLFDRNRSRSVRSFLVFFLYPSYLYLLQWCFIRAFFKYRFRGDLRFVKE